MKAAQEWIERADKFIDKMVINPKAFDLQEEHSWLINNKPDLDKHSDFLEEHHKKHPHPIFKHDAKVDDKPDLFAHEESGVIPEGIDLQSTKGVGPDVLITPLSNKLVIHYEFKPCPFCGGQPLVCCDICDPIETSGYSVYCAGCHAVTKVEEPICSWSDGLDKLQDRWNKRV